MYQVKFKSKISDPLMYFAFCKSSCGKALRSKIRPRYIYYFAQIRNFFLFLRFVSSFAQSQV